MVGGKFPNPISRTYVQGGKWGYIDNTGKIVIKPQFALACDFPEGLASVIIPGKRVFINKTGKVIIDTKDTKIAFASNFSEGLACVIGDKVWGYIDKTGKYIWKTSHKDVDFVLAELYASFFESVEDR